MSLVTITNLPVELILIVCKYLDNTTFHNFKNYLKDENFELYTRMMKLICSACIRYNYRIKLMNELYKHLDYYKQLTNYVKFKERYANNFEMPNFYVKHNDISYDCLIKTEIYKRYILNEKITNYRDKQIFSNLTKSYHGFDDEVIQNYNHPTKTYFNFQLKMLSREEIFKFTCI